MRQSLILNKLPTDLNRYIAALNSNRYSGNTIKQRETDWVHYECKIQKLKPIKKKVKIDFFWYIENKRKDPDNISFKKSILDGLVRAGILKDDGLDEIEGFSDTFIVDLYEQVIVDLTEVSNSS